MKEEEKERKMYVVTQRVVRKGILFADDLEEATKLSAGPEIRFDTHDLKTVSIEEFNPLKSDQEVEKDEAGKL